MEDIITDDIGRFVRIFVVPRVAFLGFVPSPLRRSVSTRLWSSSSPRFFPCLPFVRFPPAEGVVCSRSLASRPSSAVSCGLFCSHSEAGLCCHAVWSPSPSFLLFSLLPALQSDISVECSIAGRIPLSYLSTWSLNSIGILLSWGAFALLLSFSSLSFSSTTQSASI